ncbi:MAG: SpoIIE family protein phosphatase [Phycisphaerales bacterium]|nr:SpoIIE family protein phosphatase [Phycisphaerales bacterium]
MTAHTDKIIAIGFGSTPERDLCSRWIDPIAAAWPAGAVAPETITSQNLAMKLELISRGSDGSWCDPLVIVAERAATEGLPRLLDALQVQLVPTLVLLKEPGADLHQLESEGIVVAAWDTPAPVLAAMLFALSRRQRTVQRIAVDLRVSRIAQGGVTGEMQRLQDELASAADVQREFLPHTLPEIPEFEFGVVFRPVGYVSGDVYDVFPLDDHTIAFFIADVVGHGVPAALLTVALCRGLQTLERTKDGWKPRRPSEVLSRLNDDLVSRQLSGQRFATGIYGIIDRRTGRVTISCGGHPPPLVVTADSAREVEASGPLLGVFDDAEFDDASFTIEPGQTLVLYTDGVETAFPSTAGFIKPSKTYRQIFSRLGDDVGARGMTVPQAVAEFAGELDRQAGSLHGVDDITVVAIGRRAAVVTQAA